MFFSKKKLLGLDIGTSSIKIAELNISNKKTVLQNFGLIPTPPHAIANEDIVNPQALAEAIYQLLRDIKTKRKGVALGLWGGSVIVKRITIPRMEEALISEQIQWEAEQYIPYDISEVSLDFKIIQTQNQDLDVMDILLVAALQTMIFKTTEVVALAGLECKVLDVEGFALANCFEANYGTMPGQTIGLLNIGSSISNFVVIENGEVIFCRDIPVGGFAYSNEISKTLSMSIEEAESIKLGLSMGQAVPEEANTVIESTHEVLVEEIFASIDFFHNTSPSAGISKIFITGGAIKTPGLFAAFSNRFQCEKMDPFIRIAGNPKLFSEDYLNQIRDYSAIAIGLGIRAAGDI